MYDILDDAKRGFTGEGGQLNIWDSTLSKYVLFIPLETLPSVVGSVNSVEHDVTTSSSIGKIIGKKTLEDKEISFLWHRDNIKRIEKYLGKQNDFLVSYRDGTGWKFTAEYTYAPADAAASEKVTGNITFVPSSVDDTATLDVTDMMAKTCMITSAIDSTINFKTTTDTRTITLTSNAGSTVTYTPVSSSTSVVTAEIQSNRLTLSAKASGSAIVTIKPTATGMASWETTILVTVA